MYRYPNRKTFGPVCTGLALLTLTAMPLTARSAPAATQAEAGPFIFMLPPAGGGTPPPQARPAGQAGPAGEPSRIGRPAV